MRERDGPPRHYRRYAYQQKWTRGRTRMEWAPAYVEHVLRHIPYGIVAEIRRYTEHQRGRGTRATSIAGTMFNLRDFALATGVPSASALTPDLVTRALQDYAVGRNPRSVVTYIKQVRAFLNWHHDGEIPVGLRRALVHKAPKRAPERRPISREEFELVLGAARAPDNIYAERDVALLWILWDSGMRMSEVLSLRRKSVIRHEDGGMTLSMPRDAPHLKTGARDVYVLESVPHIEAWMRVARNQSEDAPLFPQSRVTTRTLFATYTARILADLSTRAGIRHLHPHLFRHTRATRAAEAGWNEFELNSYFGWAGDGRMAARYVHLRDLHLQERVLRDSEIALGLAASEAESLASLVSQLEEVLREMEGDGLGEAA
jgi:integrase